MNKHCVYIQYSIQGCTAIHLKEKDSNVIPLTGVKGVIFDLDGTLVDCHLDFASIKNEVGCPSNEDLLSFAERLPESHSKEVHDVILRHELADAAQSSWLSGAAEFVQQVKSAGLPMAIVTRNCRRATAMKIATNDIPIKTVVTREDAPAKPDPTALIMLAEQWQLECSALLYIGDYIYDEQAAKNANMQFRYAPFGNPN